MRITRKDLNTQDLPEDRSEDEYYSKVVLALWKDKMFCDSNTYIPKWQIVNVPYYLEHKDDYEGWVDLEDLNPPEDLL